MEEHEARAKRTKVFSAAPSLVENDRAATPSPNRQVTSPSTDTTLNGRSTVSPRTSTIRASLSPPPVQSASIPTHNSQPSLTSHADGPESPTTRRSLQRANNHRVPYFRYFGPTAIVPGFKQMVVSVRDRRQSITGSLAGESPLSNPSGKAPSSTAAESDIVTESPPVYNPNDPSPVHPLIISLVETFFTHLGCNYPFLKEPKFMSMLKEKRVEPILIDAICSLAARFSDSPILTGGNEKMPRTERGQIFAQRAKQATVDTFPCPTVGAVQACLLMAYEGFGANQDSALWMYLGLAIRMAVDLGLQKRIGIQYQGEQDPWNTQQHRQTSGSQSPLEQRILSDKTFQEEQKECEQERIDTFWAVFVLDRVISSGTGRPVTLRDDDFELAFPDPVLNPSLQWPTPFPILLQIIHLYGRVSDLLNNIQNVSDLNGDKWKKLMEFENRLTRVYKNWDPRLQFNVINFKAYLGVGQGTTFILLHFWFHALFIILHQPTLMTPFADMRSDFQLLPDSRELSMSSAKTICDILSFADLIDPRSFVGNPFTSQPMYIAACAFLMESSASASRESSPPPRPRHPTPAPSAGATKKSRHSMLASAANQNYQRCYSSLEHLHTYWGGVKYILTALDQKAKGIWDCETFTSEEYESIKTVDEGGLSAHLRLNDYTASSPKTAGPPPIAWSLSGTTNSPNSSMTLMYQNQNWNSQVGAHTPQNTGLPNSMNGTPTGSNVVHSPSRQAVRGNSGSMLPPSFSHQAQAPSVRGSPRNRMSSTSSNPARNRPTMKLCGFPENTVDNSNLFISASYTPSSQQSNGFESYNTSPNHTMADHARSANSAGAGHLNNNYYFPQDMAYQAGWGHNLEMDGITFNSQDIDIGSLGLQQPEMMGQWLDYIPQDVLGLFDHQQLDNSGHGAS